MRWRKMEASPQPAPVDRLLPSGSAANTKHVAGISEEAAMEEAEQDLVVDDYRLLRSRKSSTGREPAGWR